jgi:hypothetical protein
VAHRPRWSGNPAGAAVPLSRKGPLCTMLQWGLEAIYGLAFQEVRRECRHSNGLSLPMTGYGKHVEPTGKQSKNIPPG